MATKDYRCWKIGITDAARILNIRVTELKEAIHRQTLLRGVQPPRPIALAGGNRTEMIFKAGDVMDCAEAINKLAAGAASRVPA